MMAEYAQIMRDLQKRLSEKRYQHSLAVMETAEALAEFWNGDAMRCKLAGLLHDCGKLSDLAAILEGCKQYDVELSEEDLLCPAVIHAYLSEAIANVRYGIRDPEVLSAVRHHTLGSESMTLTDKIVFLADMIEPGRKGGHVKVLRELAYQNLDQAVLEAYNQTIAYNLKKGNHVHRDAIENRRNLEEEVYGK